MKKISLKELIIPENVKLIGSAAFYDEVSALESIKLPSKLEVIENSLFASCAKLVDIQIPDSVICIGYNAFNKCSSLKSIVIPDSVIYIENSIFSNCTSLETVYNNSVLKLDAKTLGCEEAEVYNKREWKNVNGIPTPIKK